jgi:YidC/Oxa1 family membrane protein insertase
MNLTIVSLGLFDPLYVAFGWIMRQLYLFIGNYGLVIILFTVILRGLMIPLGVKQQRGMNKVQALQGEVAEIQRRYPNDKAKQSELQMDLYKQNGASPTSGCLPSILQLLIIWPIFRIIQAPLTYIMNLAPDNITKIGGVLAGMTDAKNIALITANEAKNAATMNIPILNALDKSSAALSKVVDQGLLRVNQLIDVDFLGMNLGLTPSYKPADLFGADSSRYLPMLIIPVIVLGTTLLQMKMSKMAIPNRKKKMEAKEREKKNPARAGQTPEDKTESMMKSMNIFMPLFMLWTTFSMPAALGLYWTVGNIMMILQTLIIYFLYTRKIEAATASTE